MKRVSLPSFLSPRTGWVVACALLSVYLVTTLALSLLHNRALDPEGSPPQCDLPTCSAGDLVILLRCWPCSGEPCIHYAGPPAATSIRGIPLQVAGDTITLGDELLLPGRVVTLTALHLSINPWHLDQLHLSAQVQSTCRCRTEAGLVSQQVAACLSGSVHTTVHLNPLGPVLTAAALWLGYRGRKSDPASTDE